MEFQDMPHYPAPSPMESLAAFALAFAAGVISTCAISAYTVWIRRQAEF
jgi:hypothetical protein